MCPWHNWKQIDLQNSLPDPYQFQANASVYCFVINDQWGGYDLNKCDTCRINCMTPGKTCPSGCNCRWFPRNQNTFYVPMDPAKPLNKFTRLHLIFISLSNSQKINEKLKKNYKQGG